VALQAGAAYIDLHGRLSKNFERDLEKEGSGRLKSAGGKMGGFLVAGMAGVGVAAGAVLAKGFSDGLAQGKAEDRAAASLGLNPAEAAELGDVAGRLYAGAWGESLEQVTGAVATVRSELGDLGEADLEKVTANALDFATAFGFDVAESVAAAGSLVRNGLVADGEEAMDLLTATMQRLPEGVRDEVFAATSEYSTFFADLGVSGEEAFGLLTQAAEKGGIFGVDKVGDALKELTIRATDMSSASVEAFESAGLNAEDMAGRFAAGGGDARGALEELVGGLQGIEDPVARANAAIGLFGTPLEDLGVSEIPSFLEQLDGMSAGMGDIEGSAAAMGDTLNDNLGTKIESLKRGALQKLTDFMVDTVIPAVERFGPVVEDGIGQAVAFVQTEWPKIESAVRPIIERIVALVEEKWPAIQETISEVLATVQEVVSGFVELVTTLWENFGSYVLEFAASTFDAIFRVIGGALELIRGIVELVLGIITGDWSRAWEGLKMILSGAWEIIAGIFEAALARVKLVLQIGLDILGGIFSGAWEWIKEQTSGFLETLVGFFSGLGTSLKNAAGNVFGFLWDSFRGVVNKIIRGWNDLSFSIPGFDPPGPGPKFGGFTLDLPNIPELRAKGGPMVSGRSYLVGEEGPELLRMGSLAGRMFPNDDLVGALAGSARGAGVTIGTVAVENPVDATADEVVDAIGSKLGWKLTTRNDR